MTLWMASPLAGLDSRAQARRAAARLNAFRRAEMDFDGIAAIGHSFADELFRVMSPELGDLDLVPMNMSPAVAAMIKSVRSGA